MEPKRRRLCRRQGMENVPIEAAILSMIFLEAGF